MPDTVPTKSLGTEYDATSETYILPIRSSSVAPSSVAFQRMDHTRHY